MNGRLCSWGFEGLYLLNYIFFDIYLKKNTLMVEIPCSSRKFVEESDPSQQGKDKVFPVQSIY